MLPYVLGFAGVAAGRRGACGGSASHCLNRVDGRGIEHLYVVGMNELLAKDAAFFHENFAGSLTKRVLSFASRFEEFVDTLAFAVVANLVPLAVRAPWCCGSYDPLLVVVLFGLMIALTGCWSHR